VDLSKEYKDWIIELKNKVRSAQLKAAVAVNSALIEFYWELGKMISEKDNIWGNKLIDQAALELKKEFPEMKGLSTRNIKYCRSFYEYYAATIGQQAVAQFETEQKIVIESLKQLVSQIPWGHIKVIITKIKNTEEVTFYMRWTKFSNNE
jgi:predicted nuclease of restriction endonuclease-like (RecB) superfamily